MRTTGYLVTLVATLSLAACGGGGGGDNDDGDGGLNGAPETFGTLRSDFDALFSTYGNLDAVDRANMPTTGSATYDGSAVFSDVDTDPNLIIANPTSASSVEITADFAGGDVGGRFYDFRNADSAISMNGELDIVNGVISENTFIAGIDGALEIDGATADHSGGVMIGGFLGDNAEAVGGPITQGNSPTRYNGAFIAER